MINEKNKEDYTSSWEWTVEHSQYHFDWTRRDQPGEWMQYLGRMQGDWSRDLADAMAREHRAITWATRKDSPHYRRADGTFEQSSMIEQEENDLRSAGYATDLELSDVVEEEQFGPDIRKIVEFWGLENPWCRLHLQKPGQMFNLHIDKLYDRCSENPERISRIMIFLADWQPGQFSCYGTHNMSHWRAGDVMTFDWPNVPHASANASRETRPILMMTGLKTDRTRELLYLANAQSVYIL